MAAAQQKWKPLLTDEEQDEQYWAVINQGRQDLDASGGINSVCCQLSLVMFVCLATAGVFAVHAAGCVKHCSNCTSSACLSYAGCAYPSWRSTCIIIHVISILASPTPADLANPTLPGPTSKQICYPRTFNHPPPHFAPSTTPAILRQPQ